MSTFYTKTTDGNFIATRISNYMISMINRDAKLFKLSDGTIIKSNNHVFFDIVPEIPDGSLMGEVIWDCHPDEITHTILY